MNREELRALTCDAAQTIYKITGEPESTELYFGMLATKCLTLSCYLAGDAPGIFNVAEARFHALLSTLEHACTWKLIQQQDLLNETILVHKNVPYPTIRELISGSRKFDDVKGDLTDFLQESSSRRLLFNILDEIIPLEDQSMTDTTGSPSQTPEECSSSTLLRFYKALEQNILCRCPARSVCSDADRTHKGHLQLVKVIKKQKGYSTFHAALTPSLCHENEPDRRQQLVRIQVASGGNTVRFRDTEASLNDSTESEQQEQTPLNERVCEIGEFRISHGLCEYLLSPDIGPVYLDFRVERDDMLKIYGENMIWDQNLTPDQSNLSLLDALATKDLSDEGKVLLAYILAASVWQFYDSKWMQHLWTADRICFLPEDYTYDPSESEVTFDSLRPYVRMPFGESVTTDTETDSEYLRKFSATHRAPRILALGIVLVNLMREQPRSTPVVSGADWAKQWHKAQLIHWKDVMQPRWPELRTPNPEIREKLRRVAKACLKPESLQDASQGLIVRKRYLRDHVVLPLATLVSNAGYNSESVPWTTKSNLRQLARDNGPSSSTQFTIQRSREWLQEIIESRLSQEIHQGFCRSGCLEERTKIAIIDTGYDQQHPFFSDAFRRQRIRYRNFVAVAEDDEDQCGHGTHLASIIMKLAPSADVYIARIARNNHDLYGTGGERANPVFSRIARAIEWAVENSVDIVSMSFGFQCASEDPRAAEVRTAIGRAYLQRDGKMLFFGAPSNEGGNRPMMFPANYAPVIPIRATDALGYFERYNAPRDPLEPLILGTLGEDVEGASSFQGSFSRTDSGSSVATAIAAGVAALIIDATRLSVAVGIASSQHLDKIRNRNGILKMFLSDRLSTDMRDGRRYLHPLGFCNYDSTFRANCLATYLHDN